jgi:hypothetical protein
MKVALRVQELAEWPTEPDADGTQIVSEWLYLQNPVDQSVVKFTFSVDFFATAGHGRWWQDHRIPGGLAFTANSLGHMMHLRERENNKSQTEWGLRTAMSTIEAAAKTPYGRATWLREVDAYGSFKPFEWTAETSPADTERLKNKDCGTYLGYLHTDHAVRPEFFDGSDVPARRDAPWAMDFTYIFDKASEDYQPFVAGVQVSMEQVGADLGAPRDWRFAATGPEVAERPMPRPAAITKRIQKALAKSRAWQT